MEDWSLSKLKSHQQWLLGRIDGYKWARENLNLDLQNEELVIRKLVQVEGSEKEASHLISRILKARQEIKEATDAEKKRVHEEFGAPRG